MQRTTASPVEKVRVSMYTRLWKVAGLAFAMVTVGPILISRASAAHVAVLSAISPRPSSDAIEAPAKQPQSEQTAETPRDSAKELVAVRERHRSALAQHAREPPDPSWAHEMSSLIGRGLAAAAADGGFKILGVDCRSRTCVASVDWNSASAAYSKWPAVVRGSYGPCGVEVVLDEPGSAKARFETKLLLFCR